MCIKFRKPKVELFWEFNAYGGVPLAPFPFHSHAGLPGTKTPWRTWPPCGHRCQSPARTTPPRGRSQSTEWDRPRPTIATLCFEIMTRDSIGPIHINTATLRCLHSAYTVLHGIKYCAMTALHLLPSYFRNTPHLSTRVNQRIHGVTVGCRNVHNSCKLRITDVHVCED